MYQDTTVYQTDWFYFKACLSAVHSWLCTSGLCLNPDKFNSIILGTHEHLCTFPAIPAVKIAGIDTNISNKINSLGVIMDSELTLDSHISAICKSCYYYPRSLRYIRRSLTQDMAISVAVAIVQSRLDYCNSLIYDISTFNISKLQRVQNLTVRLALNDWHSPSHILLSKLHWLPVLSRIKFKISSITYKLLNDHQPGYLSSLISPHTPVCSLRSSDMALLTQPLAHLSIGRHVFSVCAPRPWNALPLSFWSATSLSSFKRSLKTHYFQTLTPSWSLAIARASDSALGRYSHIYL